MCPLAEPDYEAITPHDVHLVIQNKPGLADSIRRTAQALHLTLKESPDSVIVSGTFGSYTAEKTFLDRLHHEDCSFERNPVTPEMPQRDAA